MRLIAYAYEADIHCVGCTFARHKANGFKIDLGHPYAAPGEDENGLPYAATDREWNLVHPVFSTDEGQLDEDGNELDMCCGDCCGVIREGYKA